MLKKLSGCETMYQVCESAKIEKRGKYRRDRSEFEVYMLKKLSGCETMYQVYESAKIEKRGGDGRKLDHVA